MLRTFVAIEDGQTRDRADNVQVPGVEVWQSAPPGLPRSSEQSLLLPPSRIRGAFFLNADYHILNSSVIQPRVTIRKVYERSFRMRYYELFWTNFDPYNEHFGLISKSLIKLEPIFRIYF